MLAERFGGKWVMGVGCFVCSLLTIATPLAVADDAAGLIAIRIAEGIFQGVTIPAAFSALPQWLPEQERGLLTAMVLSGLRCALC